MASSSQWKHFPNTCCSKKILLLLLWNILFQFSRETIVFFRTNAVSVHFYLAIGFVPFALAPFVGWLGDVRFGRYKIIKLGSMTFFLTSILFYSEFLIEGILSTVIHTVIVTMQGIGGACFIAAMLPFLTDQLIGATSDELSAVVQWYVWTNAFGKGLSDAIILLGVAPIFELISSGVVLVYAFPLAVIIITDCLCHQWLDRTHKVTNPIKLIIQVLNYTRKHRYPERRSAFTYIDEEQPTRIDFGKEKFGGPFTEEEVEDVKTVLRLTPLVICLNFFNGADIAPSQLLKSSKNYFNFINGATDTCFYLLLIPVYRLLLHRFIHRYTPSMLNSIAIGMALYLVGYIALAALVIKGVVHSDDVQSYLFCSINTTLAHPPDEYVEWYWKLGPYLLYGVGSTMTTVLLYEFIIAQSPDKMKGFVFGVLLASHSITEFIALEIQNQVNYTICSGLTLTILLVALFVVFLVFSKRYTLRERNREINIQAIVEEHYDRYMDQEEEYIKEQQQIRENCLIDSSTSDSSSDSTSSNPSIV